MGHRRIKEKCLEAAALKKFYENFAKDKVFYHGKMMTLDEIKGLMNIKCKKLQTYAAGILVITAVLSGCGGQTASEHVAEESMAYEAGTLVMGTGEEGVQ